MPTLNPHSSANHIEIPPQIMEELIAWSVKLSSGRASAKDKQDFEQWCAQDPAHAAAWQQLHAMEQTFSSVPMSARPLIAQTITRADQHTRAAAKQATMFKQLGVAAITLCVATLLANQFGPWQQQTHYATAIGQHATYTLTDGTQLTLNTQSSVDIHYGLLTREVILNGGEIYLETGKDSQALFGRRAFWVKTPQAGLEAIGTRFSVYQQGDNTQLYVTEGIVAMHRGQHQPVRAYANESYHMQGSATLPIKTEFAHTDPNAWLEGVIVAKQMRLDALMTELSRYQTLSVRCDADVGSLTVSGVFQLNRANPAEHALQTIAQTLPIRISRQQDNIVLMKK